MQEILIKGAKRCVYQGSLLPQTCIDLTCHVPADCDILRLLVHASDLSGVSHVDIRIGANSIICLENLLEQQAEGWIDVTSAYMRRIPCAHTSYHTKDIYIRYTDEHMASRPQGFPVAETVHVYSPEYVILRSHVVYHQSLVVKLPRVKLIVAPAEEDSQECAYPVLQPCGPTHSKHNVLKVKDNLAGLQFAD